MRSKIKKALFWFSVVFGALAVMDQVKRPPEQRTWNGEVYGVPYDFRPPTPARLKSRWWNSSDPRLFVPKAFGVGWDINFYRLVHMAMDAGKGSGPSDEYLP